MASGYSFGAITTAPTFGTGNMSFGTVTTAQVPQSVQPQPSFGFGVPSNPQPTGGGFQFSTPPVSTGTNLFGVQQQPLLSTGLNPIPLTIGATTTAMPNTGLFNTTTTSGIAPTGLTFGAVSTAIPTLGTTTIGSAPLTFGLGGTTNTAPAFNLPTTAPTESVGLGGVATTHTKTVTTQKEVSPKEQPLPKEIFQSVDQFKEMVKLQKQHSSDISRCSVRDFRKVEQDIDLLTSLLNEVESQLQKNRHLAEKLKYNTARCLQNIEMAQRTQDTPPGLQYENTAPLRYFLELADQFEREMQVLKFQIESADKYVKNHRSSEALTPQDLALGMRRLHDTFVTLAGHLQSVHSQVESQKETYLNILKQIYNDHRNPFEKLNKPYPKNTSLSNALIYSPPKVATGPTPFSNMAIGNGNPLQLQQGQTINAYQGGNTSTPATGFGTTISFGSQLGAQPSSTSLFGSSLFGQTSFNPATNFQLQKPPTGNKRGKQ